LQSAASENDLDPELLLTRLLKDDITGVFVVPTRMDRLARLPETTLNCHCEHGFNPKSEPGSDGDWRTDAASS